MKKSRCILAVLLCAVMVTALVPAVSVSASSYSGTCGDNLTWSLNTNTGVLTISGTGDMAEYNSASSVAWYSYRTKITSITIEDGVTSISDDAFYDCTALISVTIPDSVTGIGARAFYDCTTLESVWINSIESWCNIDFGGGLTRSNPITNGMHVEPGNGTSNPLYYADDFYVDGIITTEIVIPASVTAIKNFAFYGFSGLTNITLPESITSIGNYAFSGCSSLTNVTIPKSVASIGAYAFKNCESISGVAIPEGVTSIGAYAFSGCNGLMSVSISDSVIYIGSHAFYNTAYYKDESNWEDNVLYINRHLIKAQTSTAGSCNVKSGTLTIADNAFEDCKKITRVTMPEGVVNIGEYAFCNCKMMTSVTMPESLKNIGAGAFGNCTNLTSAVIQENVTYIDDYMFYGCSELISVQLSESVKNIGASAFSDCISLTDVYYNGSKSEWNRVKIGEGNESLVNATIHFGSGENEYADGTCGDDLIWVLYTDGTLTISGTGKMEDYSLYARAPWNTYSANIKSVIIKDNVTNVGDYAFYKCTAITNVTIGNGVTSIGDYAFYGCTALGDITMGNSITTIGTSYGGYVFYGCTALENVYISDLAAWCNIAYEQVYEMMIYSECYSTPMYYADNFYINGVLATEIVIPDSVTEIKKYAFYGCACLTSVTIPDSVTSIGGYAFYRCSGLMSITIGNGVTSISDNAFYCSSLENVYINDLKVWCNISFGGYSATPMRYADNLYINGILATEVVIPNGVEEIKKYAFSYCAGLTSVTIPNSVKSIALSAFYNCTSLRSIVIPNSVTNIGMFSFNNCTDLTSVTLGSGLTYIDYYAFAYCDALENVYYSGDLEGWCNITFRSCDANPMYYADNLYINGSLVTDVVIPDSVTEIKSSTFYGCSKLTSVKISNEVTIIDDYAFYDCGSMMSISIPASVTSIGWAAFYDCNMLTDVYYGGSEEDWAAISIEDYNEPITSATIYYNNSVAMPTEAVLSGLGEYEGAAEAEVVVGEDGEASVSLVITDSTVLSAENVTAFAVSYSGGVVKEVSEMTKTITSGSADFAGSVSGSYRIFIWDENMRPVTESVG